MQSMQELLALMARLRDPEQGCPWDRAQSYQSLVPYTLEEAHEVADAIERHDYEELCSELGDLLFQVVFYAQIAQEQGLFDFQQIAHGITEKMIRRHPHVFADQEYASLAEQKADWESIKQQEQGDKRNSALDGVPLNLPALTRALKLQQKAARVGFDWTSALPVLDKIEEEIGELRAEIRAGEQAKASAELGDVLFAVANLARHLQTDPEQALRNTNRKFEQRFHYIEARLAEQGRQAQHVELAELDALWEQAKRAGL